MIGLSGLDPKQSSNSNGGALPCRRMSPMHPGKRLARLLLHPNPETACRALLLINCLLRYDVSLEALIVFLNSLTHKFVWVSISTVIEVTQTRPSLSC